MFIRIALYVISNVIYCQPTLGCVCIYIYTHAHINKVVQLNMISLIFWECCALLVYLHGFICWLIFMFIWLLEVCISGWFIYWSTFSTVLKILHVYLTYRSGICFCGIFCFAYSIVTNFIKKLLRAWFVSIALFGNCSSWPGCNVVIEHVLVSTHP